MQGAFICLRLTKEKLNGKTSDARTEQTKGLKNTENNTNQ